VDVLLVVDVDVVLVVGSSVDDDVELDVPR
jgi:hypothetical protein